MVRHGRKESLAGDAALEVLEPFMLIRVLMMPCHFLFANTGLLVRSKECPNWWSRACRAWTDCIHVLSSRLVIHATRTRISFIQYMVG